MGKPLLLLVPHSPATWGGRYRPLPHPMLRCEGSWGLGSDADPGVGSWSPCWPCVRGGLGAWHRGGHMLMHAEGQGLGLVCTGQGPSEVDTDALSLPQRCLTAPQQGSGHLLWAIRLLQDRGLFSHPHRLPPKARGPHLARWPPWSSRPQLQPSPGTQASSGPLGSQRTPSHCRGSAVLNVTGSACGQGWPSLYEQDSWTACG